MLSRFDGTFEPAPGRLRQRLREPDKQPDNYRRVKPEHWRPNRSRCSGGCRAAQCGIARLAEDDRRGTAVRYSQSCGQAAAM